MKTHPKKQSLSEVNQSVRVPKNAPFLTTLRAFLGPGALVAVGYMDPGNWITSVVGGASYQLFCCLHFLPCSYSKWLVNSALSRDKI